jgi:hypothetical protein
VEFVASTRERIRAAEDDWLAQRFARIPGETEFIPLPERRPTPPTTGPCRDQHERIAGDGESGAGGGEESRAESPRRRSRRAGRAAGVITPTVPGGADADAILQRQEAGER